METSIPESQIPSETADCYDFPFSTSAVWASKTVKLLRLQGPTVEINIFQETCRVSLLARKVQGTILETGVVYINRKSIGFRV